MGADARHCLELFAGPADETDHVLGREPDDLAPGDLAAGSDRGPCARIGDELLLCGRPARCGRTLALPTLMFMAWAASRREQDCKKRSSRIRRYRAGRTAMIRAIR